MFTKNSRYLPVQRFAPSADGSLPFKGVRARLPAGAAGVVEHTLETGERFDHLATEYYNDSQLWWRIVDANADLLCALQIESLGLAPAPGTEAAAVAGAAAPSHQDDVGIVVLIPRARD
jgi:hypothetical protein